MTTNFTTTSTLAGIDWPAIPAPAAANVLAVLFQLEQSQWWPAERLRAHQYKQLRPLLIHAQATVPHYQRVFAALGFDPRRDDLEQAWSRLPILDRPSVQALGNELHSMAPPPAHGSVDEIVTSGSTGTPVRVRRTEAARFFWGAITLREHLWHRRDAGHRMSVIRSAGHGVPPEGKAMNSWGSPFTSLGPTGPCDLADVVLDTDAQRRWLIDRNPHYILTHPTSLRELANCFRNRGGSLPNLQQMRTVAECLPEGLRELVREVFGVPLIDMYSAKEVGYIALQCPDHEHYHAQSETMLVEVLDDAGRPCNVGKTGRVVVTSLHNFATPLIRYEIMDFAQVGPPCPCGRGLPVLQRIIGRQRNMVVWPDGTRHWPSLTAKTWAGIGHIRQHQLVQHEPAKIEARLVVDRPLTDDEMRRLQSALRERLGFPFEIQVRYVDVIPRSTGGKFEEFMCMIGRVEA